MAEQSFRKLAAPDSAVPAWMRSVYEVICRSLPSGKDYVADSSKYATVGHSVDDVNEIRETMYRHVRSERIKSGVELQTLEEAQLRIRSAAGRVFRRIIEKIDDKAPVVERLVSDGFWNPRSGIGSVDDPGMYNYAFIPVSMSPQEATAYYSSGGVAQVIIDKKCKGALMNGYGFGGDGWDPDEFEELHDYGENTRFGIAVADSLRDGLVFGGAICYPRFRQDTTATLENRDITDLCKRKIITKDAILHWVTTDRWNCVLVPNWNVTAEDYVRPAWYYIPIGGVKVATARSALVRPRMLPYWGMLPQLGWGISDFEGWIPSLLMYRLAVNAIPLMAQQISLLFHEIPLDGALMMNGINSIQQLLAENNAALASASTTHPVSLNSFGKLTPVERHYEGFGELIELLQVDLCANCELPHTVVFPAKASGLADTNTEDVLLKQAESVQKISNAVAPQYRDVVRLLALSCFGPEYFDSAEGRHKLSTLYLTFNPPSVQTNKEKAESGAKFAAFVQTFASGEVGLPLDAVLEMSQQFFPDVEISDEIMDRIRVLPESATAPEIGEALTKGGLAAKLAGTVGPTSNLESVLTQGSIAGKLEQLKMGSALASGGLANKLQDAEFVESEHPRNERGEFTEKGGGSGGGTTLKSFSSHGLEYGSELPDNVFLHGSEQEEEIDVSNLNQTSRGTFFLSKNWETAAKYSNQNEKGIKVAKLNTEKFIDLKKPKDRKRLAEIMVESIPGYEHLSSEELANSFENLDLDEDGFAEGQGTIVTALYENGIWGIIDATRKRSTEVLTPEAFEPLEQIEKAIGG